MLIVTLFSLVFNKTLLFGVSVASFHVVIVS